MALMQGAPLHCPASLKLAVEHVNPSNLGMATLLVSVSIEPPTPWAKLFMTFAKLTLSPHHVIEGHYNCL